MTRLYALHITVRTSIRKPPRISCHRVPYLAQLLPACGPFSNACISTVPSPAARRLPACMQGTIAEVTTAVEQSHTVFHHGTHLLATARRSLLGATAQPFSPNNPADASDPEPCCSMRPGPPLHYCMQTAACGLCPTPCNTPHACSSPQSPQLPGTSPFARPVPGFDATAAIRASKLPTGVAQRCMGGSGRGVAR